MLGVGAHGNQASKHPPDDLQARQPEAWPNVCQNDLGGDDHDAVGGVEICRETMQVRSPLESPWLPVSSHFTRIAYRFNSLP